MSRVVVGTLLGCGILSILGILLLVALVVGVGIGAGGKAGGGGVASDEGKTTNIPKKDEGSEEYIPLVLRLSGEQGTPYKCTHKNMSDEGDVVFEEEEGCWDRGRSSTERGFWTPESLIPIATSLPNA